MSDTQFTKAAPGDGSRVELAAGTPPHAYVVKTWVGGQLVDEKGFANKAEAERYQVEQIKRHT